MQCLICASEITLAAQGTNGYISCSHCGSMFSICKESSPYHLSPFKSKFCPICGADRTRNHSTTESNFSRPLLTEVSSKTKLVAFEIGFPQSPIVFSDAYDLYIYFVDSFGTGKVFLEDKLVNEFQVHLKSGEKVKGISSDIDSLYIITSKNCLIRVKLYELFNSSLKAERIAENISSFAQDRLSGKAVYSQGNVVHEVDNLSPEKELLRENGSVANLQTSESYLFYSVVEGGLTQFVCKSLKDGTESRKTVPSILNPSGLMCVAKHGYIATSFNMGDSTQVWAGRLRFITINGRNWASIDVPGIVSCMNIDKEGLLYLQLNDRLESKAIASLTGGVNHFQKHIPNMLPGSMVLSGISNDLSYGQRVASSLGNEVFTVKTITGDMISEGYTSPIIEEGFQGYHWYHGRIAVTQKINGVYICLLENKV